MMKELYEVCDILKKDIRTLNAKNDISPTELDRVYKAVDIIKDIKTIEAMENAVEEGYSGRRYYYDDDMSYARRGRSNDGYSEDGSYRRGRSNDNYSEDGSYRRGRYASRDGGYSGHEDKEEMMREIEELKRKVEEM